ncbi:hypothetical protein ACR9GO_18830 [Kosakonia cowanii]
MAKYIAFFAILTAWTVYFYNFSPLNGFPADKGDWGTFGDFIGGVTNPILTFTTIVMLIRSIALQQSANESLIKQNNQMMEDSARQKKIEDLRSFESTFYNLAQLSRREFEMLVVFGDSDNSYQSERAVKFIETSLIERCRYESSTELMAFFSKLDDASSMSIFSVVRSFYVLFKFTNESCPDDQKERYYEICNYTMPIKFIHLVSLAYVFSDWKILKDFEKYGFFSKKGIKEYIDKFNIVKFNHDK